MQSVLRAPFIPLCLSCSWCLPISLSRWSTRAYYRKPSNMATAERRLQNLEEFYPFYKGEHKQTGTRILHFTGTSLFILQAAAAVALGKPRLLLTGVLTAYGCAWVGHCFAERNRPATFKYPFLSLVSDFIMWRNILTGKESLRNTTE